MNNYAQAIYKATSFPIPEDIIKEKDMGYGKDPLSYISGTVVTDYLNEIFDFCWSWIVTERIDEPAYPIWSKKTKEVKEQTILKQDKSHIVHVRGILTAPIINPFTGEHVMINKEAFGSKTIYETENESNQESKYKAAATDALKKAASMFGIGRELRSDDNETRFREFLHLEMSGSNKLWTPLSNRLYADKIAAISEAIKKSGKTLPEFIQEKTDNKHNNVYPCNIEEIYQKVVN